MRTATDLSGISFDRFDREGAGDLRRRRTRALSEHVLRCASFASAEDRALVEGVYGDGLTAAQVARLSGETPRSVRRRVRRLVRRFVSERFVFVLSRRGEWSSRRRAIATACVLQGRTLREAAARAKTSLHVVRKEMAAIDALLESERAGGHVGGGRADGGAAGRSSVDAGVVGGSGRGGAWSRAG